MFSAEQRCVYRKSQLVEVICQLRYPEILTISANAPAQFQEMIRKDFPVYTLRREVASPKITGTPGNMSLENQPATPNYQFSSADGIWRINLTSRFVSLSCSVYNGWENFALKLDQMLAAFIRIYKPAFFERIGLRYVNAISRTDLSITDLPFRALIQPEYLGPFLDENIQESAIHRCSVDVEIDLTGSYRAKIHAGPGLLNRNGKADPEVKFIFDQDLFLSGNIAIHYAAATLDTMHSKAFSIFRGAITETLHNAMEAEYF